MKKIVLFILFNLLSVLFFNNKASAGTYDNAITYYNTYGDSQVAMLNENDGYIYFCSAGKTSTSSTRYRTVGYTITLYTGGEKDSVEVKLGGNYIKDVSVLEKSGYTYVLRRVKLSKLQLLFNGNKKITWNQIFRYRNTYGFDAIMTVYENGKLTCGDIKENSDNRTLTAENKKHLYKTASGIKNARKWARPGDLDSFFNKYIVFNPVNNIDLKSISMDSGDNIYYCSDHFYVRKGSDIKINVSSTITDEEAAEENYHPNYNILNVSGWGNNQLLYVAQGYTKSDCTGGMLKKTGDGKNPLNYKEIVKKGCSGSKESLCYFNSCAKYSFEAADDKKINIYPEARAYYGNNYPSKDSDISNLCDEAVEKSMKLTLISDAEKPIIDIQTYISSFGNVFVPFNISDKGSGIRKVNVYKNDGTLLISRDYSSKRKTSLASGNDYCINVVNGMQIYITAEDNVGNKAVSSNITFSVPVAHTVKASVTKGLNGYNCNEMTSYVYGGNSDIASLVVMSENDENPSGKRVVLTCQDVAAGTMPAGLRSYTYSLNPMNTLLGLIDGKYDFSVISGGRYVSSDPALFSIDKDTTSPEISITVKGDVDGWHRRYTSVNVNARDNYSGMDNVTAVCENEILKCRTSKERPAEKSLESRFDFNNEGINTVEVVATDKAGNIAKARTTIKIDSSPPEFEMSDAFVGASVVDDLWLNRSMLGSRVIITDKLSGFNSKNFGFMLFKREYESDYPYDVNDNDAYNITYVNSHKLYFQFKNEYIASIKSGRYEYKLDTVDKVDNNKRLMLMLNVDVDPPKADTKTSDAWSPVEKKGNIHITDEHSGIDSIIVYCDGKEIDRICEVGKKEYNMYVDASGVNNDEPEVRLVITDKVGNCTEYLPKVEAGLSLYAYITRCDYETAPILMTGESAKMMIIVYGKADRIVINYPDGLKEYDADYKITPQKEYEESRIFKIPYNYDVGKYNVSVKAYRNGRSVEAVPYFEVMGKVTAKIRTRLRI